MVRTCVAFGCSKTKQKDGVTLFKFPKDAELRKKWTDQVRRTRLNWSPTDGSELCMDHFTPDCFEPSTLQYGIEKRLRLNPGAIPTIFKRPQPSECAGSPPVKKRRYATEKLSQSRMVHEMLAKHTSRDEDTEQLLDYDEGGDHCVKISKATQTEGDVINSSTHTSVKNKGVQACAIMKTKGTQNVCKNMDVGVQCSKVGTGDVGVQCSTCSLDFYEKEDAGIISPSASSESEKSSASGSDHDITENESYQDENNVQSSTEEECCYIVYDSCLMSLFGKWCPQCYNHLTMRKVVIGTFLSISQSCSSPECHYSLNWESQPFIKNLPLGNIMLSGSILFSGALPTKTLRVFENMRCATISCRTFFRHQETFLQPVIERVWSRQQTRLLEDLKRDKGPLVLGGDGRADSPGHSAKYGSYSVVDLLHNNIIDVQLVQSNEVANSNQMEKEGLMRAFELLMNKGLKIGTLITDRHVQIAKWVREEHPTVDHRYDVWHVAKGFRKKVEALSLKKNCELAGKWSKSLINHLYWCASSTNDGNGEMMHAKWMSVLNHIHNKHHHKSDLFPKCQHGRLNKRKKWITPDTEVSDKLIGLIKSTHLCNAIKKLSPIHQTSNVESFHSVIIHFCPKHTAFSYEGMNSRLHLSALHYNENKDRCNAKTKEGEDRYCVVFPKYKKGGYITRRILVDCTFNYVKELFTDLREFISNAAPKQKRSSSVVPLSSSFERPNKKDAIDQHMSRFKINK